MDDWIDEQARRIAARAERETAALVDISTPSGDVGAAERAVALTTTLLPDRAEIERVRCSSTGYADDLIARVHGGGSRRLLLLGHLDTVVAHDAHRPAVVSAGRMNGSGTIDMKGGVALALALMSALAGRPQMFRELSILMVMDEEWRTEPFVHAGRFTGYDACLCFEAGELDEQGREGVVVRRKAAATLELAAHGRSAHSGAAPGDGCNALLAMAQGARVLAELNDPDGDRHLTVVPTLMEAGEGLNVVPASARLTCDMRADHEDAFDAVLAAAPHELDGVRIGARIGRLWPGLDSSEVAGPLLSGASARAGLDLVPVSRGGASDASHLATTVPLSIDGLGPRGGGSHAPDEHLLTGSFEPRARVALALALQALDMS